MGLSPLLVDTYRRYKRGTKAFTQWLGTTARATGLVDHLFSDQPEKPQSRSMRRKKDKDRVSQQLAMSHKILVKALVSLATAIEEAKISTIPRHVLVILEDVISARKDCASWYRAYQLEENSSTMKSHEDGHEHIIKTLEAVRSILSPPKEKVVVEEATQTTKATQSTNCLTYWRLKNV
jgi:hypothetical protein